MDRKVNLGVIILGIWFSGFHLSFGEPICDITLWYSKQYETGIFEGELTHDQRSVQLITEDLVKKSEHNPQEKFIDCNLLDKYEILLWGNLPPQSTDGINSATNQNEVDESEIDETEMFEEDDETGENTEKKQESASNDEKNDEKQNRQPQEGKGNIRQEEQEKEIDDNTEKQKESKLSNINDIEQQLSQKERGFNNIQQEKLETETKETEVRPNTDTQEQTMKRNVEIANSTLDSEQSDDSLNKKNIDGSIEDDTNDKIESNKDETVDQADDKNMEDTGTNDESKEEILDKNNVMFGYCRNGMSSMLDVFDLTIERQQENMYSSRPMIQICPQFKARRNFVYSPSACLTAHTTSDMSNNQNNLSESRKNIDEENGTSVSEKEYRENNNIPKEETTSNSQDQANISQMKRQDVKSEEKDKTIESVKENNESKQKEEMRIANEAAEDASRNLKEYFNRKSDEYSIKIQSLEITLMKLQNQVLMEKLEKQNHTSTITRLENHILKLENELLKINQSYYTLKSENEAMDRRQRKYLELDHSGAKEQDAKHYEIISKQQENIAKLKEILNNQTTAIDKIRSRSDYLEDQNRMLYQMVMNQTTLMSQIMSRVQTLTEENIKQREEARQLKEKMDEKLTKSNFLQTKPTMKQDEGSNELLNNLNILTTDNQELKIKPKIQMALKPVINYRWCGKKVVSCLSEITAAITCPPFSSFQWAQCDTTYFNIEEDPPIPNANVEITQEQKDKQNAEKETRTSPMPVEGHAQTGGGHLKNEFTQGEKINENISAEKQQNNAEADKKRPEQKQAPDLPDPQDVSKEQQGSGTAQAKEQIKEPSGQEHGEHRPNLPVDQERTGQTSIHAINEETENVNLASEAVLTGQRQEQANEQMNLIQDKKTGDEHPHQNYQASINTKNQPVEQIQKEEIKKHSNDQNVITEQKNIQINEKQITAKQNQENTQTLSKQEQAKSQHEQGTQHGIQDQINGQKKNEDTIQQQEKKDDLKKEPNNEQAIQQENNKDQTLSQQQNGQTLQQKNEIDDKQDRKDSPDNKANKEQARQEKASTKAQKKPLLYSNLEQREPKDCYDHYINRGSRKNGAYKIRPLGQKESIEVFCDMKNGGWTVLQKRQDGTTNFYRDWKDYKEGFGGVYGEQWIGLDYLHHMTNQEYYKLRIDLIDWNKQTKTADYGYFVVDNEEEGYKLHIGEYSGDAGDGMGKHNQNKFSTRDMDNDKLVKEFGGSCAKRFNGAWWYYKCYMSNLNGKYYRGGKIPEKKFDGITWKPWTGPNYSMKIVVMKIRPNSAK